MRARAFAGLRRFQGAVRPQHDRQGVVVATRGRARLIHYEAKLGRDRSRKPILFIPSLINPPHILDLTTGNSLIRYLANQGHDVYKLDWETPGQKERNQDIAGHVTDIVLPMIAGLSEAPILAGYCLGGTMAIAAAQMAPCAGLATIAAPWFFSAYPEKFRQQTKVAWDASVAMSEQLGVMPMEVLQAGFWSLDPHRTIGKYATFADMPEDDPGYAAFLLLEDWVNEGPPLTLAAGRDLIGNFYGADLPGAGSWVVAGTRINPTSLQCPTLAISSSTDKLVPQDATPPADCRITLGLGHVGMVVGRSAPELLWGPLSSWFTAQGG